MRCERSDMTDWVIHFVHARNEDNDAFTYDASGDGTAIPYHADANKAARFDLWDIKDSECPLEPDASALSVLLRILDDGHIRTGWCMRKRRPTVYGPRPVCCFTEMPLHALLHYARTRGDRKSVDVYGIALPKSEVFAVGGRPVIYGLSGQHKESNAAAWPRRLDASCGIGEHEQHRYVATKMGADRPIDWTHEREWRWADTADQCGCPGLPVWLDGEPLTFSRAIIIVRDDNEANRVLDKLKEMHDGGNNYDYMYNRQLLEATRVLVLDSVLKERLAELASLRIEDIKLRELSQVVDPVPSQDLIDRARKAVVAATIAAAKAAEQWRQVHDRKDVFGFGYMMIGPPQSAEVQALLKLNALDVMGGIGYKLKDVCASCTTHLLGEQEAAVEAAIASLKDSLPGIQAYCRSLWD